MYSFAVMIIFIFVSCQKDDPLGNTLEKIENISLIKKYTDPNTFMGEAYCYYVYQNVIDPNQITPGLFAKYIKGGTLSLDYIDEYNKWLAQKEGRHCKKKLNHDFSSIKRIPKKKYVIFINNFAIEAEGKNPETTYNHERLHVAFSVLKQNRVNIARLWNSLPLSQRESFMKTHPGYNFSKQEVLWREFYAYRFEESYKEGIMFLLKDNLP